MTEKREKKDRRHNARDMRLNKVEQRFHIRRDKDRSIEKERLNFNLLLILIFTIMIVCLIFKYFLI